jgi:glycosyltransferase involved in cell wall biosynthesis
VIDLSANVGVHLARARGVEISTGDVIGFVDGDDWIHPEMVKRMRKALDETQSSISICGILSSSVAGRIIGSKLKFRKNKIIDGNILTRFCNFEYGTGSLCNKLYRRDVISGASGREFGETVLAGEDYIVNVGAFAKAKRVVLLPSSFYYYRENPESVSRSWGQARRFAQILRSYVICLETYATSKDVDMQLIDALYRRQLRFECYRVSDTPDLDQFRENIALTLNRLAAIRPEAIYSIAHVFDEVMHRPLSFPAEILLWLKQGIKIIYKRIR